MNLTSGALRATLLGLSLACAGAIGAPTKIAQVPLLNIEGTGTVKPNLMVLYDTSGSMAQTYTPDYVDDYLCRAKATASGGRRNCEPGDPPFMSADFNRQYYNPRMTYSPPVTASGGKYPSMTSANTKAWTEVTPDGFKDSSGNPINKAGLDDGLPDGAIDLTKNFPDLKWCNGGDCRENTTTYTYPDNLYTSATKTTTAPYYYTIRAAEYCQDESLTTCVTVTPGAAAPTGYPIPAKVRWCTDSTLTSCQAKYLSGSHTQPRFSSSTGSSAGAYGLITVGIAGSERLATVTSVTVGESGGPVVITNGQVAGSAADTPAGQAALANALAASIVAKTGLTNQYTACVKTPLTSSVPKCATWGIELSDTNLVAVIPIKCVPNATSKGLGSCSVVTDDSRHNWAITVATNAPSTAFIKVEGTGNGNKKTRLNGGTKLGSVTILSDNLDFDKSSSATAVAAAIANKIGTSGTIRAYAAPNSVTSACAAKPAGHVCLVDTAGTSGLQVTMGSLKDNGSLAFTLTPSAVDSDELKVTGSPISTGGNVFVRTDIVPTRETYPRDIARTDCVTTPNVCTYAEEMTNFANWYAYYKTRNQMMKVALGRAFEPVNGKFRVGIVSLGKAASNSTFEMLPKDFEGTARSTWYEKLYRMNGSGGTPLRPALHNVGKMYANTANNVVEFPCQQNFTFLTTDGYWNGDAAADVTNNDNVEDKDRFCSKIKGCVDTRAQNPQSLADVALYWYNGGSNDGTTTLNSTLDKMSSLGQVPAAAGENRHLHMKTYTLGLGITGVMDYDPKYDTSPKPGGDFYRLITGATGCPWNGGGTYVWPDPKTAAGDSTVQERVDDLWHAAVNGHGKYFSAADPDEVVGGLNAALSNIQSTTGASAAAATSTPNISQEDNDIFTDTFTTVKWTGELSKKKLDVVTGDVLPHTVWSTNDSLGTRVSAAGDTRVIKMWSGSGSTKLKNFKFDEMTPEEKAWFKDKCPALNQCSSLSTDDRALVNSGANLVDWLRGQQQYANDTIFRVYDKTAGTTPLPIVLGDIASAKPAYMRDPRKSYPEDDEYTGYTAFKEAKRNRQAIVFAAANDGMLHAFKAGKNDSGEELWAYAPRIPMKKLHLQASTNYGTNHQFTVDGSPEIADVKINGSWKTVLVAGLNAGGRGYYALDVTDPAEPKALWEICADPAVCAINDPDIGLSFSNPQIGRWNGEWVVMFASGYNNIPGTDNVDTGNGGGYLYAYDIATGARKAKIPTGSGDTTTPSGLAKITAISEDPDLDANIQVVYGGDNLGQLWSFKPNSDAAGGKATLLGTTAAGQPITTRPEVTSCRMGVRPASGTVPGEITHKAILFGTGRLLDLPDITDKEVQSLYMIKDTGTSTGLRGASMAKQTLVAATGGWKMQTEAAAASSTTFDGWYMDFDKNVGERVNLDPKVVRGTAIVVTNVPAKTSTCSVGGTSNFYELNMCTGGTVSPDGLAGRVLSNSSAAVGFIVVRTSTGKLRLISTSADGKIGGTDVNPAFTADPRMGGWRRIRN